MHEPQPAEMLHALDLGIAKEEELVALGDRRFLFITGKGGVGKTTVAGSLGLSLAKQGKRVLIAMCKTKERLSAILGTPPITSQLREVKSNLWAVNLDPEVAMPEYGLIVLKVKSLTNAVFGNSYVKTFLRAVPGISEWAMLGKAWWHTTEKLPNGENRFDVVLFDAPATGHGVDMLRVPKVILDVAPPGVLRRDAQAAWDLFRDRDKSGVVIVTLPEEMPTTETLELRSAIEDDLGLPVLQLIVNGVLPPLFSEQEREELLKHPELLAVDAPLELGKKLPGASAVIAGARRAMRESVQRASMKRLLTHASDLPVRLLPALFDEASTAQGTSRLAALL